MLTFDSTPTANSTNPVTSGGVYTALSNKADVSSIPTTLWQSGSGTNSAILKNSNLEANNPNEVAVGKYNYSPTGASSTTRTVFSVGVGTSNSPHNALVVKEDGKVYLLNAGYSYSTIEEEPEEGIPVETLYPIGYNQSDDCFAWAPSYDISEGDDVYGDSAYEALAVDGDYIWYSEEEPFNPPISGTIGFIVNDGKVDGFLYNLLLGYLATDQTKRAYITTNGIEIGISVYSDDTCSTPAVNGHYICVTGDIISFDVTNGLISNVEEYTEEEEEEPEEVMPADGMDPNSGGGDDEIPEDPGEEEEPEEEVPEEPTRSLSLRKAPMTKSRSTSSDYTCVITKDPRVNITFTSITIYNEGEDFSVVLDEDFTISPTSIQYENEFGEEVEEFNTDFEINIWNSGTTILSSIIQFDRLSSTGINTFTIVPSNDEVGIDLQLSVEEEPTEEIEELPIVITETLSKDLASLVRQGYFGRVQVHPDEWFVVTEPEEEGDPSIADAFG